MTKCDKCKKLMVLHAFSEGECKACELVFQRGHIPCGGYCDDCAKRYNICYNCGEGL